MRRCYFFIFLTAALLSLTIKNGETRWLHQDSCSPAVVLPGFPIVSEDNRSFDFAGAANLLAAYPGKEIIARKSSQILIYSSGGEFLQKYDIPWIHAYAPASADFDGDGQDEIVFGSRPLFYQGAVYVIDEDGLHIIKEEGIDSQPVIADLNNDGAMEIIAMDYKTKAIHVIDRSGQDIIAPIVLNISSNQILHSPLAVGDLNRDGFKEIVLEFKEKNRPGTGLVQAFQFDGTLLWSAEVPHSYSINTPYNEGNELVLGDMDADGFLDVVLLMVSANSHLPESHLMIFGPDGSLRNDWSIDDAVMTFPSKAHQQLALADLDGDQTLEIILTGMHNNLGILNVYKPDGESLSGFPIQDDFTQISTPRAADVNAGGVPKAMALLQNYPLSPADSVTVKGWTPAGRESPCGQVTVGRVRPDAYPGIDNPYQAFLDDIDGNGTLDGVILLEGEIHGVDMGAGMTDVEENLAWPMYGHDPRFTRNFEE